MAIQVFVGFGGSGGKTLAQLAELIADDGELSDRAEREFYFLLVDTDRQELDQAESRIRAGFKRVSGAIPVIERVLLSEGVGRLQDLVHLRLGAIAAKGLEGRETVALKEAKRHWFFRGGHPFSARRLPAALAFGAGQCPLAAHFAAWDKIDEMKEALRRLRVAMQRRFVEQNDGLVVDLVVVGSLAGGTGRGCWQLLALAARTIFPNCKPHAYLFDASVFAGVAKINPDQAWRMRVNSYTGLSELVGWIRNDLATNGNSARFALPPLDSLDSGQFCIDTNDIALSKDAHRTGRSPADNFYIITGASKSHTILDTREAYTIAAIALLARLAIPQVSSSHANGLHYGSCGATIARVPVTAIHECVVACAKELALEQLLDVDHLAAKTKATLFCDKIDFTAREAVGGAPSFGNDSMIALYRSEMKKRMDLEPLKSRLKEGSPTKDVLNAINDASLLESRKTDVQQSLTAAVSSRLALKNGPIEENLRAAIEADLQSFFGDGGTKVGPSGEQMEIGTSLCFLDKLASHAIKLKVAASSSLSQTRQAARDLNQELKELLEQHEDRRYKLFGERWEELERETIESGVIQRGLEANASALTQELVSLADTLARVVEDYRGALRPFVDAVYRHEGACQQSFHSLHSQTFMCGNLSEFRAQLGSWHTGAFAVTRHLKPTDSMNDVRKFVADEVLIAGVGGAFRGQRSRMIDGIRNTLLNANQRLQVTGTAASRDASQRQYEDRELPEFLRKISVPAAAMQRRYSLQHVVEAIEHHVRHLLNENIGDVAGCEGLQDSFEAIFGVRHARAIGPDGTTAEPRFEKLPADLLMHELAFALASQCDPMFEIDAEKIPVQNGTDKVTVFIPFTGDEQSRRAFVSGAEDVALSRWRESSGTTHGTRWRRKTVRSKIDQYSVALGSDLAFAMVAHTHFTLPDFDERALDGIKSFQGWRTDTVVREWLQLCESADAESVFRESNGNFGVGYIHPDFLKAPWREVRNDGKRVSGHRWAPWQESPTLRRQSTAALDAILYAMCGNTPARKSELVDVARKVLEAVAAVEPTQGSGYKWSMPLLKRDGTNGWKLTRQCFGQSMGLVQATHGNWKAGMEFSTLQQFVKWIGGPDLSNLTTEGREFVAAVQAERDLVHQAVVERIEDSFGSKRRSNVVVALGAFLQEYTEGYLANRTEEQRNKEKPLLDSMLERVSSGGFDWEATGSGE